MQSGIRTLLFTAVIAAVLTAVACALFVSARNIYYSDRRQTEFVLAQVKGISNVQLHSHVDLTEEVNSSRFTVDAYPGSVVSIGGLMKYADHGRFSISRVGKWTFRVRGRRHVGPYEADTGEQVESEYYGSNISLSPDSPYKDLIPFEVNTLQDLADHYGELVDMFETWPREAEPGTVTLEDGTTEYYFVVEEGE
ncbi:MAG: hypothetical protein JNL58_29040 [Planctomyces sp.]|nr:hypothetical protein [Planctomyces sp.]